MRLSLLVGMVFVGFFCACGIQAEFSELLSDHEGEVDTNETIYSGNAENVQF